MINHLLLHYTLSVVYNWVICRVQIRCLLLHPSSSCDFTTSAICSSTYHHIAYIGLVQLQPPKTWGVTHSKEQHCTVCLQRIPKCTGGQCTTYGTEVRGDHTAAPRVRTTVCGRGIECWCCSAPQLGPPLYPSRVIAIRMDGSGCDSRTRLRWMQG